MTHLRRPVPQTQAEVALRRALALCGPTAGSGAAAGGGTAAAARGQDAAAAVVRDLAELLRRQV